MKSNGARARFRHGTGIVLALGVVMAVTAACTQPPPPTFSLEGQRLTSEPPATIVSGTCDPGGESIFTVEVSGEATGPYPGTFVETITVTIGPQTEEFQPGQFRGDVTALESTIEITSTAGDVQATTTLDPSRFAKGVCQTSQVANWTIAGQVSVQSAPFEAQQGSAVASGDSGVSFNMYDADCFCSSSSPQFQHSFSAPSAP